MSGNQSCIPPPLPSTDLHLVIGILVFLVVMKSVVLQFVILTRRK